MLDEPTEPRSIVVPWRVQGTIEADREFVGAFRTPELPDPKEWREFHDRHSQEMLKQLGLLLEEWEKEDNNT